MKKRIISTLVELQILAMSYYEDSLHLQLNKKRSEDYRMQQEELFRGERSSENKENSIKQPQNHTNSPFETLKPSQRLNILSMALSKIPQTRKSQLSIIELKSILNNLEAYHSPVSNNYKQGPANKDSEVPVVKELTVSVKRSTLSRNSNTKFNFENHDDSLENEPEVSSSLNGEATWKEGKFEKDVRPTMDR